MNTPFDVFPEMTLRDAAVAPPMVVFGARTLTPVAVANARGTREVGADDVAFDDVPARARTGKCR